MASVRGHPFIVRLAFAFHTRDRAFLVSEFMAGGDLFTLMRCVVCVALPCLAFSLGLRGPHGPLTADNHHHHHHLPSTHYNTTPRRHGRMPDAAARVYAGEVALALQHLHDHGIIFRSVLFFPCRGVGWVVAGYI